MSTVITTQEIMNVHSMTDNIEIRVNIRDGMVAEIGFKITDPLRLGNPTKFLLPHSNSLDSLEALQNQIEEVLLLIRQELGANSASR